MQPYLFPYIGYFQLINAVDTFVIYDDVAFIKRGWINRNRLRLDRAVRSFTVPLADASQNRRIRETQVALGPYEQFRKKFFATSDNYYSKSAFYRQTRPILADVFDPQPTTIADMARHSIEVVCRYLGIPTRIVPSSTIYNNCALKKAERLIDICRREHADTYINPAGGKELYTKGEFSKAGIELWFLESSTIEYRQIGGGEFIPNLSIIDVMMNNSADTIRQFLTQYELI